MKISVFYEHIAEASQQTGRQLEELLNEMSEIGISGVDIDYARVKGNKEEVKDRLQKAKLTTASVYGFFDFGNTFNQEEAFTFIDAAYYLGARRVLVIAGFVDEKIGIKYETALNNMVIALNKICDYAESKNIIVTFEDFDNDKAPFSTDEELLWFMERVPKLRCAFDTGNFKYQEIDELKAFELLKDKIVHVHLKDRALSAVAGETPVYTVKENALYSSPVGAGCIKIKEILNRLKSLGYKDYIAIEHFGSLDQLEYIKKSAGWVKEQLEL